MSIVSWTRQPGGGTIVTFQMASLIHQLNGWVPVFFVVTAQDPKMFWRHTCILSTGLHVLAMHVCLYGSFYFCAATKWRAGMTWPLYLFQENSSDEGPNQIGYICYKQVESQVIWYLLLWCYDSKDQKCRGDHSSTTEKTEDWALKDSFR